MILCGRPGAIARGEVDDAHRGNLRHEDLAAVHALEVLQHEVDALLQA